MHNLLLINGNTTATLTERLHRRACAFLGASWLVSAETARFGFPYVTRRTEVTVAAHAILETAKMAAKSGRKFDACLIACFGEPGIAAVREASPVPVVGMAEASVLCALQVGRRYAIVTVGEHWPAMIEEYLRGLLLFERCVGIIPVSGHALALAADRSLALDQISIAIEHALSLGADSVIVGGAAIAGFAHDLQGTLGVPLIDSLDAGLAQVEALSRLRLERSASNITLQDLPVATKEGN
jgi:Asp/Glu/hydantoin racemase